MGGNGGGLITNVAIRHSSRGKRVINKDIFERFLFFFFFFFLQESTEKADQYALIECDPKVYFLTIPQAVYTLFPISVAVLGSNLSSTAEMTSSYELFSPPLYSRTMSFMTNNNNNNNSFWFTNVVWGNKNWDLHVSIPNVMNLKRKKNS